MVDRCQDLEPSDKEIKSYFEADIKCQLFSQFSQIFFINHRPFIFLKLITRMNHEKLLAMIEYVSLTIHSFGNNLLGCLKEYNAINENHLTQLRIQLNSLITFGNDNYPRIMVASKDYG